MSGFAMKRQMAAGLLALVSPWTAPAWAADDLQVRDFWPRRAAEGNSPEECVEVRQADPRATTNPHFWVGYGYAVAKAFGLLFISPLTVLVPHPGLTLRERGSELSLSWSGSAPIGTVAACRRRFGIVDEFYGHRLVLEGTWLPARPRAFTVRAGHRIIHHPTSWPVGVGAGLAAAVELAGPQATRPGVSPELVLHLGRCCSEFYWLVSLRWDRYFTGADRDHLNLSLGLVYW